MISIVIVNWNSGNLLERCVRSIVAHCRDCRTVIIDNGSTDASLDFPKEISSNFRIIRNRQNEGFARASNAGWRASDGDFVLFLNPDIECLPESVDILRRTMKNASCSAVGGHLVDGSGRHQAGFNVRSFPTKGSLIAEMLLLDRLPWFSQLHPVGGQAAVEVDQPAAACLMVTREALQKIGGFDERFHPAWFEDVDLCRRIRNSGGRILYQPAARFVHQGGYSVERLSRLEFLTCFHTNQLRYFRKHFGAATASSARRWIITGMLLRSALSLLHSPLPEMRRSGAARTFLTAATKIRDLQETEL